MGTIVTVVRIAWRRSGVSRLMANRDGARRSHLSIFRGTKAFFTLGVIAASTASGLTAQADIANWSFYKGAAFVKSSHSRDEGGMVGVFDVEVRRTMTAMDQKDMICDYQAQVRMTLPNGHAYTDNSPVHNGCNATVPCRRGSGFASTEHAPTTIPIPGGASSKAAGGTTSPAANSRRSVSRNSDETASCLRRGRRGNDRLARIYAGLASRPATGPCGGAGIDPSLGPERSTGTASCLCRRPH